MKHIINENFIIRVASIETSQFQDLENFESEFYQLEKKQIILEENIRKIIFSTDKLLFELINKLSDDFSKKQIINLKRRLKRKKQINLEAVLPIVLDQRIIKKLQLYQEAFIKRKKLEEKKKACFLISDAEFKKIMNIYLLNEENLNKSISISSFAFLTELQKATKMQFKNLSNKKKNDLTITLYKYLIRAAFKTSPFSFFCLQGIAKIQNSKLPQEKKINKFNKREVLSIVSDKFITKIHSGKIYKINRDICIDKNKGTMTILKKEILDPDPRNLIIKNGYKIVEIKYDSFLEDFIINNKKRTFNYNILCKEMLRFFKSKEEVEKNIDILLNIGILEYNLYSDLESLEPPSLKKINLKNRLDYLKNNKVYENVFFKNNIYMNTFLVKQLQIELLNKLTLLFDDSLILKYRFVEFIGETKTISIIQLSKMLNEFYNNQYKSNDCLLLLRSRILSKIENNIKNGSPTILNTNDINDLFDEIYKKINLKKIFSYIYFLQPISEQSFVLNKIFSGFGRMYSKFPDVGFISGLHKKSLELVEEDIAYVDLYGFYGYNANAHPFFTKHVIDLENIWGGDNLTDLVINVDYEKKDVDFYLRGEKIQLISMNVISSRNRPVIHRFLCDINQIDAADLDLTKKIIFDNWKSFKNNKVTFIPEVKMAEIILSRNKWLLNISLYKKENNEVELFSELIRDAESGLIPFQFYVRPLKVKYLKNIDQMNDIYKPQYINLKNVTSYKLLFRIIKKSKILLLEQNTPNSSDKERYPGDFRNNTIEIGVENYFIPMENN